MPRKSAADEIACEEESGVRRQSPGIGRRGAQGHTQNKPSLLVRGTALFVGGCVLLFVIWQLSMCFELQPAVRFVIELPETGPSKEGKAILKAADAEWRSILLYGMNALAEGGVES